MTPAFVATAPSSVGELGAHLCRSFERFGEAEVQDFDLTLWSDLHIGWLKITMDDAFFMSCFERFTDVLGNIESFVNWNRTPCNTIGERLPFYKF